MKLVFSVPSEEDIKTNCIQITDLKQLRDGTLGKYRDAPCLTCTMPFCPGHVGYYELNPDNYIPHPIYHQLVPKILECICQNCNKVIKTTANCTNFNDYHKNVKTKFRISCSKDCETVVGEYKYTHKYDNDKGCFIYTDNVKLAIKGKMELTFAEVKDIFKNISSKKIYLDTNLNVHNLIMKHVLILPDNIRNGLTIDGTGDVYTRLYETIMRSKITYIILNSVMHLIGYTSEANGDPMIRHMLTSKSGLMRSSLMCSRQNESARSVITSDSRIPLSHVGVPQIFKDKLPINVYIKDNSIDKIIEIIKSDEFVSMGNIPINNATKISKTKLIKLLNSYTDSKYFIKRCLRDDDWVFINRQPTLHRHSILAFQVQLVPQRTITLNLACVTAFNADFDGDEITLYVASDKGSIEECKNILSIKHNIVSPEDGKLVVIPVQDCITGTYIMTESNEPMPKELIECLKKYVDEDFTTPNEAFGLLCKKQYQSPVNKDGLIKIIKQMGPNEAITFMTKLQLMVDDYLKVYPLSVCYSNFNPFTKEEVDNILNTFYFNNVPKLEQAENAKEEFTFYSQQIETQICKYLDTTIKESILNYITEQVEPNDLLKIIDSKAKGKKLDLVQSWVALCQQYVFGRQKEMFGMRSNATIAEKKGFVTSSYGQGLDEAGLYFQATAARSTIINTGVNTADPGYLQRQLSKFMADVVTDDECHVLNHDSVIIAKLS